MGGDEFLIILENTNEVLAETIIKTMKIASIKKTIVISENEIINVSAAFGYATRYSQDKTFDDMFKDADDKMYHDKKTCKFLIL